MSDFRDISPKSITWRRGGKGNIYANRVIGEKTIKFQLPKMNCNIAVHSPGMFRMELKMSPSIPIHAQFMDWIADLEQSSHRYPESRQRTASGQEEQPQRLV